MASLPKTPPPSQPPTSASQGSVKEVRRTWGPQPPPAPNRSPIPKQSQAELIRKLEEEERATLELHSKLKEAVNVRLELEELKKKVTQMLSDVRDALVALENEDFPSGDEEKEKDVTPALSPEEEKRRAEEEKEAKERKKAEERIQKERKKAEERQKKLREKELSLIKRDKELTSEEDTKAKDSTEDHPKPVEIEVKSAFRKVDGITIDQLRQNAGLVEQDSLEGLLAGSGSGSGTSGSSAKKKFSMGSISLRKKKDKASPPGLAEILQMKQQIIANERDKK